MLFTWFCSSMSSGRTDTIISNGAEDIRRLKGSRNRADVQCSTPRECCSCRPEAGPAWALLGFALQRRPAGPWLQRHGFAIPRGSVLAENSENIKSSHQFLARLHRLFRVHPAEHFLPTLTIHCCEFAHELVARFPFCVFAEPMPEREQRGSDPDGNVCRGDQKHKNRKPLTRTYRQHILDLQKAGGTAGLR